MYKQEDFIPEEDSKAAQIVLNGLENTVARNS